MSAIGRLLFKQKNMGILDLRGRAKFTRKRLSDLRKQRDRWEANEGITDEAREAKLTDIKEKMASQVDTFNQAWNKAN